MKKSRDLWLYPGRQIAVSQTQETANQKGDNENAKILSSLKIAKVNVGKRSEAQVQFTAHIPVKSSFNTMAPHRDYNPKDYVKNAGEDPNREISENPIRLFIRLIRMKK